MRNLKNVTLEMSLKPFTQTDAAFVEATCREAFAQWGGLLRHTDGVSVMLWTADGSEILEYKGLRDEPFEWAKFIGGANPKEKWAVSSKHDPDGISLHTSNYLYTERPPLFTYGTLADVVDAIKRVGREVTGKPIRVGATFDPGPEFAKSAFKYVRHPEILLGDTMGAKSFVCCYQDLHGDSVAYAGFPLGIPEGTPFGTFLGRQSEHFLRDMGFDYLWLSNGFGFGSETWGTTGAIFGGEGFAREKMAETQANTLRFWEFFRAECPDTRVETRGTNLTAGIDLASDGVNLKGIYEGGFNILPPPNSPWAALDGDFGLELAGYMSRIAELPSSAPPECDDFLYRFYVHDPWWMNSPWIDRYEGQPHDIYLPLAICRLDSSGKAHSPNHLNLLSIDNSLGELTEQCASEVIPHLLGAYEHGPDAPSPCVWAYPFREYHEGASASDGRVGKPFAEDWFIRGAINNGFPLSTVVSTNNYIQSLAASPGLYEGSVVVTPIPPAGGPMEQALTHAVRSGASVILYGSVQGASDELLQLLNLARVAPITGRLDLRVDSLADSFVRGCYGSQVLHTDLLCDGGIDTALASAQDPHTKVLAEVANALGARVTALHRCCPEWQGGSVAWVRGASSNSYRKGAHLLAPHDPEEYFPAEAVLRLALQEFGYHIGLKRESPQARSPVTMVHRHDNAFFFSGYVPDTTAKLTMRFPLGAPLLMGSETRLEKGHSTYHMPRAWHAECRAFVHQAEETVLSCREIPPVSYRMRRRFLISGLVNATVRILPQKGVEDETELLLNSNYPHIVGSTLKWSKRHTAWGEILEAEGVTGALLVSSTRR